jgi:outer membrane protein TolC
MSDLTTAQTELVQAILTLINQKTSTARAYIRLQKALGQSNDDPKNTKTYCAFGLIQKKIQVC